MLENGNWCFLGLNCLNILSLTKNHPYIMHKPISNNTIDVPATTINVRVLNPVSSYSCQLLWFWGSTIYSVVFKHDLISLFAFFRISYKSFSWYAPLAIQKVKLYHRDVFMLSPSSLLLHYIIRTTLWRKMFIGSYWIPTDACEIFCENL